MTRKAATRKIISFKLSKKEYQRLKRIAEPTGLSIGQYVRGYLLYGSTYTLAPEQIADIVRKGIRP